MTTRKTVFGFLVITLALALAGRAQVSTAILPGFDLQTLARNDDGSTDIVPIGFAINFYGATHTTLYVNNNGNVTFANPQPAYTPTALTSLGIEIIAPFWADVDTRNPASAMVTYGAGTVDGHAAFGVDWVNVGYYAMHADSLLSCQMVILDRSDIAPGDFDLEFNYAQVQWQWGDVTVGIPPRAGFASGTAGYELPGSGIDGAFMDTNSVTGLIYNSLNSSDPGRYVFSFRDGTPVPEPTAITLLGVGLLMLMGASLRVQSYLLGQAPKRQARNWSLEADH